MKFRFLSLYFCAGFLFLMVLGIFLPLQTNAASPNDILVGISPENPAPGENTNINLNSYAYNLDTVSISWSINGKSVSSGVGKKTLSLSAPRSGEEARVVATIALPDGPLDINITVRPNILVLLWQADDSYTPPFYRGKAMPSPESEIKVVAMPEIKNGSQMINPKNMTYAWKKDYNNEVDGSGYGKNSFTYTGDYLDDSNNISVEAMTTDQNFSSSASLDIGTVAPKIVFYKNDINLGTLWEQVLQNGHLIKGDEIIEAAPYFMSPKDIRIPILNWSWSINDRPVDITSLNKNWLPLKTQEGISGTSKIDLKIENAYKIFESASKEITVEF